MEVYNLKEFFYTFRRIPMKLPLILLMCLASISDAVGLSLLIPVIGLLSEDVLATPENGLFEIIPEIFNNFK